MDELPYSEKVKKLHLQEIRFYHFGGPWYPWSLFTFHFLDFTIGGTSEELGHALGFGPGGHSDQFCSVSVIFTLNFGVSQSVETEIRVHTDLQYSHLLSPI